MAGRFITMQDKDKPTCFLPWPAEIYSQSVLSYVKLGDKKLHLWFCDWFCIILLLSLKWTDKGNNPSWKACSL